MYILVDNCSPLLGYRRERSIGLPLAKCSRWSCAACGGFRVIEKPYVMGIVDYSPCGLSDAP